MIRLKAERALFQHTRADVIVRFLFEDEPILRRQMKELEEILGEPPSPLARKAFAGKLQQTFLLHPRKIKSGCLLLVGLGKTGELSIEKIRRAAATAAKVAQNLRAATIAFMEPDPNILPGITPKGASPKGASPKGGENLQQGAVLALAEGSTLGLYRYEKYLSADKRKDATVTAASIVTESPRRIPRLREEIALARIVCEATILARDLENAPGNEIYPESLARLAKKLGRRHRFRVSVLDEREIRRLKMGGLLAVGQGSAKPPRFIILEQNRASRNGTVVLVGKGVTFDSGGISIKPSANMAEMKMDMSGAAAVIGTMQATARLRLPMHILGLIPATENLPGGAALKPGDIVRHLNGKTSEIDNTDAEGRLILADALSYASRFKPDLVVDLATLTGACVVALGHAASGMLGNDEPMMARLKESGERTFERVWALPMFDEYERLIKSDIADVKNTGGRWAGAISAAMFLKAFVGNYRWIHLDIAGTAIMEETFEYIPKGGSGVGVRILIDFLRRWKKG